MKYRIAIPPASAKRLEKDRRFVIEAWSLVGCQRLEYAVAPGADFFELELPAAPRIDPDVLDADVNYLFWFEYRNATGSRLERITVPLPAPE